MTTTTCFRGVHAFIIVPFNDILTVQTCECVAQFLRMDPNLLRECAQRLIETANFIRGSGVDGGSVASSSAPSNTSNTRPRTDDNTSISSGSSGSHRAVPNTAPSVSESAWQEHNRIFGYSHRDLRDKVEISREIQGKVVVMVKHMVVLLRTPPARGLSFAWPTRVRVALHRPASGLSSL